MTQRSECVLDRAIRELKEQHLRVQKQRAAAYAKSAGVMPDGSPTKFYKRHEHFGGQFKGTKGSRYD